MEQSQSLILKMIEPKDNKMCEFPTRRNTSWTSRQSQKTQERLKLIQLPGIAKPLEQTNVYLSPTWLRYI